MMAPYNGRKFFSTFGRWAMVAKMLGILPNCFVSPSKVSRTSGAAFSFTSGLTLAMRHLLICEGITWSQEFIPNTAQTGNRDRNSHILDGLPATKDNCSRYLPPFSLDVWLLFSYHLTWVILRSHR